LTTAATLLALNADVENYSLASATNSVTLGGASQNVTGNSGADTISVTALTVTGTLDGGAGTANTLTVKDGADISGATISNFTNLTFDATGVSGTNDVTMTAAQYAAFSGTITAAGTEKVTLSTASTNIASNTNIENYVLTGAGANTITLSAAGQSVTTATDASAQTINTGTLTTYTGTITGNSTDTSTVLSIGTDNTNISGATLNIGASTGVDVLAQGTHPVIMSAAQHASLIGVNATAAITGTGAITINSASTSIAADATPTAYILTGAGANTITLGAASQNVTTAADNSAQIVKLGTLVSFTGVITGNSTSTSDTLEIDTTNTDISTATTTTVDKIDLVGATIDATMTAAQAAKINAAAGTNTVTLTTAATSLALSTDVEHYVLGNFTNSVIFTSDLGVGASTMASIDGGSGNDTITLKADGVDYVQITGNTGIDTIDLGASHTGAISIVIAAGTSSTTTATAVTDVVTHFVAGVDTFALGVAGSSVNYAENETSVDSLSILLTNADSALDGTKLYYFGVTGGNGYLVTDDATGAGANNIIQLTGIVTFADAGAAITS
jgi:hypothetical protein